jgi:hypothetical protein
MLLGAGAFARVGYRELDKLRELLVVLFEKPQGPKGLDAGRGFCGIGELSCGEGVLVDGDGGVGALCGIQGSFGMIMRLLGLGQHKWCYHDWKAQMSMPW